MDHPNVPHLPPMSMEDLERLFPPDSISSKPIREVKIALSYLKWFERDGYITIHDHSWVDQTLAFINQVHGDLDQIDKMDSVPRNKGGAFGMSEDEIIATAEALVKQDKGVDV